MLSAHTCHHPEHLQECKVNCEAKVLDKPWAVTNGELTHGVATTNTVFPSLLAGRWPFSLGVWLLTHPPLLKCIPLLPAFSRTLK